MTEPDDPPTPGAKRGQWKATLIVLEELLDSLTKPADTLDAMMSPRRYRPARSPLVIDAEIAAESGKQFDPGIVAAFMAVRDKLYPPIDQKRSGESACHAIESMVDNQTETVAPLPVK